MLPLLAWLFWPALDFYLGNTGKGIGKLVTFGGLGIWALIDAIKILFMSHVPTGIRPAIQQQRRLTMLYCYTCGYGNEDNARFCYSCGRQMLVESPVPQSPLPAPVVQPAARKSRKLIAGVVTGGLAAVVVLISVPVSMTGGESIPDGSDDSNITTLSSPEIRTKEAKEAKDYGIGVGLEQYERDFGGDMGFEFEDAPLPNGRSRKMDNSPNGVATLELIGPGSNLTQVTLALTLDSSKNDLLALYMMAAFAAIIPDHLAEGLDFFNDSFESLQMMGPDANDSFVTQQGDIKITVSAVPNLPIVLLSFTSPDAPIASMVKPTPPPTAAVWNPGKWKTGQYEPRKILKGAVLWVGASGNGGLKPGRYEYRDINGGEAVNENGCHLVTNWGEPNRKERRLAEGSTFSVKLGPIHGYASFGGYRGSTCRGSLYWMGS